ncbi:glutaredoxin-like protein NrdH [Tersicoccus sp. Bi-70]|uniref:glutaredoxin-like protein NrdH n=1 Tax=Tersicoccus sp. Bi-70 TaxID=1897634 RepID=UPI0009768615|nr:glutaredoxin-like protein NrdH [Tersicoccus sp. Bi-70]OMH36870.1 NrdH-redoxin [Tersicoccus sp. Bi-70]
MAVTVYTKPACVQCNATYRALDKKGVVYQSVDISQDPQALEELKAMGYLQAPVVVTDDDSWSGFRPDKIATIATGVSASSVA